MKKRKGLFIVFEGIDGSGTTTQSNILQRRLLDCGFSVALHAEPTIGPIGSIIRQHLIGRLPLDDIALALLFAADRSDHINNPVNGIKKFQQQGTIVISDRYLLSSLVYQQDILSIDEIFLLNKNVLVPDLTFFLRIDPQASFERKSKSTPEREKFDHLDKQTIFAQRYLDIIDKDKLGRIEIIDASKSIEEVASIIWEKMPDTKIL